jgi:hypothetical protein
VPAPLMSEVIKKVRALTDGRREIDFAFLTRQIFGRLPNEITPIRREIMQGALGDLGFRQRSRSGAWTREA